MHASKFCHRDIKPENILFVDRSTNSKIKLIDFGLSSTFGKKKHKHMHTVVGTPYYIAPEVLDGSYKKECDIWSLGVLMYIVLTSIPPFAGSSHAEIFAAIRNGKYNIKDGPWTRISSEAKDLINRMIVTDPTERISIKEILAHPWLKLVNSGIKIPDVKQLMPTINKLKNYMAPKRLKKEAIKVMFKYMTAENYDGLLKIFRQLDTEGTGYITAKNLRRGLTNCGLKMAGSEIKAIINRADYLKLGSLNYTEFLMATVNLKEKLSDQLIHDTFCHVDS
jgi:calcium-dependent protein kinase